MKAPLERSEDILWRHLTSLPYFRAMVRAVEDSFYQGIELAEPVLDLGSGDGHFASVAFDRPLTVGLDPWWGPLRESRDLNAYRLLVQADGGQMPFSSEHFASAVSNSVLEHIPHVDAVLAEVARVLQPGGHFIFCVPNHRFPKKLLGKQVLDTIGLRGAAESYTDFFNRISRHQHCDSRQTWEDRLHRLGFRILEQWDYFDANALHRMEVGHALGLPAFISRKIFGKWILSPTRANLYVAYLIARRVYRQPVCDEGVYSFYITQKIQE